MTRPRAAVSWSGGKDSCLALHRAKQQWDVCTLITMFTADGTRSRSHGLRPEVIQRQAELLGLELICGYASWQTYEGEFTRILRELQGRGFGNVIFGDIFLADHKLWVERVCGAIGLEAHEPLWQEPTDALFREFIEIGGQARIVAARATALDQSWLGRELDETMLPSFRSLEVDPCGEKGEYHTLVTRSPHFTSQLEVSELSRTLRDGYWMLDLQLAYANQLSA
jgi:diphthine-ammonia ligase